MGIGPSSKETTLHHFKDPLVEAISNDSEIDFMGVAVEGTPEINDNKLFVAKRAGALARAMRADGVIVSIDSWGNSHIDFTSVIEAIGEKGIPVVGLSFVGNQASFVVTNRYMDTIIDMNKNEKGIETTVVGENNTVKTDAIKAVEILKLKIRKKFPAKNMNEISPERVGKLIIKSFGIDSVSLAENTRIEDRQLFIDGEAARKTAERHNLIKDIKIDVINPGCHDMFINSILDFSPIATKVFGRPGEGITHEIDGVKVMLTGVEEDGFQPANIGSSEGILKNQIRLGRRGTPLQTDTIIHVDVVLSNGAGRSREGIMAAHRACDEIIQQIRECLKKMDGPADGKNEYYDIIKRGGGRVLLVKIVSGLGCMYDTGLFPDEPAGYAGCRSIMDLGNMQVIVSPNEYRDGIIRSLS